VEDEDDDDDVDQETHVFGAIVAALRLAAVEDNGDDDFDDIDDKSQKVIDPLIKEIREAARADKYFVMLIEEIQNDFHNAKSAIPFVQQFRVISDNLSIYDGLVLFGPRLVVPWQREKKS